MALLALATLTVPCWVWLLLAWLIVMVLLIFG
jgi:hypothetical protein